MGVCIDDNKLVIITEPKTIRFNLAKKVDSSLKHETDHAIKCNGSLAKHTIKKEISQFLSKFKNGDDIHKHGKE